MIKRVVSRCWISVNVSSLKGKSQGNYTCIEVFVTHMFSANFNHKTHLWRRELIIIIQRYSENASNDVLASK